MEPSEGSEPLNTANNCICIPFFLKPIFRTVVSENKG